MHEPHLLEVPEWAIQVFEKQTGLRVVVHDLSATWGPFLLPERFKHRSPCCVAVKARHDRACVDFEVTRLRAELPRYPEGRCHRCHAGFVEWIVPAFVKGRLAWVLFAGQRRAETEHRHLVKDIRATTTALAAGKLPALVDETESGRILESLRQLRARLLEWHGHAAAVLKNNRLREGGDIADLADRKRLIQGFLHSRHTEPVTLRELARALHLGESRASHLVTELFGQSFVQLLTELRLRTAASLLRDSALSVSEVSLGSGFRDLSHFHRCFHKRFDATPLKYRRLART